MTVITQPIRKLLDTIGKVEAGERGYDAMYLPAEKKLGQQNLTAMTVKEVRALQNRMVKVSASSACGRYQFIRATLAGLVKECMLTGNEKFNEQLQDMLAVKLLERRGLLKFMAGQISRETFANNLSREWASLPVVTPIEGQKRLLQVGESYYAGDGLNHALVKPKTILSVLDQLRTEEPNPKPEIPETSEPEKPDTPEPRPDPDPPEIIPEVEKPKLTWWQKVTGAIGGAAAATVGWLTDNIEIVIGVGAAAVVVGGFLYWKFYRR